jgi:Tol biopolymer transport system component
VAVEVVDPKLGTADLLVHYLERGGAISKLTSDLNDESTPVWSPNGQAILFKSDRGTGADASPDLFTTPVGGMTEEVYLKKPGPQTPEDWSKDWVVFTDNNRKTGRDIWLRATGRRERGAPIRQYECQRDGAPNLAGRGLGRVRLRRKHEVRDLP